MFIYFTGICTEKCLNGGKCIQKDTCQCPKGFYGLRCEYCKCFLVEQCLFPFIFIVTYWF